MVVLVGWFGSIFSSPALSKINSLARVIPMMTLD